MNLKNVYTIAIAAILLTAFVGFAYSAEGDTVTVKGELVDTACYMAHPADGQGEEHRKCASSCIKRGVPMSVLDAKGDLYLLLPDHSKEKPYEQAKAWAADEVEISGKLVTQGGLKAIVVDKSSKATE